MIYNLVFGTDSGQVNCCFHDDSRASSGISNIGQFNCFACGAKAHSPVSFAAKYFGIGQDRASKMLKAFDKIQTYKYSKHPVEVDQRAYLNSCGISDEVIDEFFYSSAQHKLMYHHKWNNTVIGYTWFNAPQLKSFNAGAPKYKYDFNNVGGMVTPYHIAQKYKTIVVCEGEKDMLTARSKGVVNAVAKVGGARTYIMGGVNFQGKNVILIYDCDKDGREGAEKDAEVLTERFGCKVKVVDLGLKDKEDLNDYFMKYGKTKQDLDLLILQTKLFVPDPTKKLSRVQQFYKSLSSDELLELQNIIKEKD